MSSRRSDLRNGMGDGVRRWDDVRRGHRRGHGGLGRRFFAQVDNVDNVRGENGDPRLPPVVVDIPN